MFDDHDPERDLDLRMTLAAPRPAVWRCFTEADLVTKWFAPAPWTVPEASLDVRPGGHQRLLMAGTEGERAPVSTVYVDVAQGERLVSVALPDGTHPLFECPMMTIIIRLADAPEGTHYHATVRHFTKADQDTHESTGFHDGWTLCGRQLEATARALS